MLGLGCTYQQRAVQGKNYNVTGDSRELLKVQMKLAACLYQTTFSCFLKGHITRCLINFTIHSNTFTNPITVYFGEMKRWHVHFLISVLQLLAAHCSLPLKDFCAGWWTFASYIYCGFTTIVSQEEPHYNVDSRGESHTGTVIGSWVGAIYLSAAVADTGTLTLGSCITLWLCPDWATAKSHTCTSDGTPQSFDLLFLHFRYLYGRNCRCSSFSLLEGETENRRKREGEMQRKKICMQEWQTPWGKLQSVCV